VYSVSTVSGVRCTVSGVMCGGIRTNEHEHIEGGPLPGCGLRAVGCGLWALLCTVCECVMRERESQQGRQAVASSALCSELRSITSIPTALQFMLLPKDTMIRRG
jgi:hypothetical protein